MMRQIFLFLVPFLFLIVQGCSSSRYHTATPYHRKPESRQVIEQRNIRTPPLTEPVVTVPENSIAADISFQASQLMENNDLEAAAQTLERGLRIVPKDAYLWSQLATVRLQQRRYGQAQSLAAKSNSLARGNTSLRYKNQVIGEKSRKQQGY